MFDVAAPTPSLLISDGRRSVGHKNNRKVPLLPSDVATWSRSDVKLGGRKVKEGEGRDIESGEWNGSKEALVSRGNDKKLHKDEKLCEYLTSALFLLHN